ncbi:MAG: T9SS type A sorting domain-containing protein [Saprospiraceae bacterium]|nr:T9SS type A sorting domain-containing protein [Saprospiraceae bacterium]
MAVVLFNFNSAIAQERNCGSMIYLQSQMETDPEMQERLIKIEQHTRQFINSTSQRSSNVITIPVVVHVVYDVLSKNVSDAQIISQIDVLNKDFRRLNADRNNLWSQAGDMEIEFCLAVSDPEGKPTNGITRTNTLSKTFQNNNNIKSKATGGKDPWPADQYLNIWVCDIAGTVLGFAQFPGGSLTTDGIVVDYQAFGTMGTAKAPFNLGRTTTHEVGHWLNLRHIWGDGDCSKDDFVNDTPTASSANYKCNVGKVSCGGVNMVQNYMDYSDDACMNLFTIGQKSRMRALFAPGGFRNALLNSHGCKEKVVVPDLCKNIKVKIKLDNYPQETSWLLKDKSGKIILVSPKYTTALKGKTIETDTCLSGECFDFVITDSFGDGICCKYGSGFYEVYEEGTLLFSGGTFKKSETKEFCIITSAPTCADGIQNGTEEGIDCGGICIPCPSCNDNIQNGNETGIDCGGQDCQPCITAGDSDDNDGEDTGNDNQPQLLMGSYFENGWDGWQSGGIDCSRYSGPYSWEGDFSIKIMDNSGLESAMISPVLNISNYAQVKIEFSFYAYSMEPLEDFWLIYNDGTTWQTIKAYIVGTDFHNNHFYEASFIMDAGSYNFSNQAKFGFQCDASTNEDQIYIDAVRITGIPGNTRISENNTLKTLGYYIDHESDRNIFTVGLYPNPVSDIIQISGNMEFQNIKLFNPEGRLIYESSQETDYFNVDLSDLHSGMYFIHLMADDQVVYKKIFKN